MNYTATGALFSKCNAYRYSLSRTWHGGQDRACFIMLNPSTATAEEDDPTIRRCVGYAIDWGYEGVDIVNMFAFRSTDPNILRHVRDPVGSLNDHWIRTFATSSPMVVCAWGANGSLNDRDVAVRRLLQDSGVPILALAVTKDRQPRHPLYLRKSLRPTPIGALDV